MDFTIFAVYNTCRHGVPQPMTQMEGQRQKLEHVVEALYLDDSLEEELNRLMEEMTEPPQAQAQAETMDLKVENTETKTQAPSDSEHIVEDLDDSNLEEDTLTVEMAEPPEVQAQAETMDLKIENTEAKTQASLSRLQDKNSLKLKKRVISQAKQLTDELLICFYFVFHIMSLFNNNN